MAKASELNISQHVLVPKHELLSDKEKRTILDKHSASLEDFPKILITDPAILHLGIKEGDMIKITRESLTAGDALFYRVVIAE